MEDDWTEQPVLPYGAVAGGRHACMLCNALNCVVPPVTGAVLASDGGWAAGQEAGPVEHAVNASIRVSFARQTLLTIDQTEALERLANLRSGLKDLVILNPIEVNERKMERR